MSEFAHSIELAPEFVDLPSWHFGDTVALGDELGMLVVAGKKTATCSLFDDYAELGENLPQVGERDIVLDGKGKPLCVIETIEVEVRRAGEIDEAFAHDEGEGDRTLPYWRAAHMEVFARRGTLLTDDTKLVCERFKVVHRF